ncbi:hypothetical protein [Nocardioides sp. InS609-2]|uniref:hypothetical protein n=1 Tax=Nocardioides sp. InS609-2 TaxID=2760705 RepID=UPI0020C0BDDB|nr:hypothetical protein [Nocardioides sp. InS609-2]
MDAGQSLISAARAGADLAEREGRATTQSSGLKTHGRWAYERAGPATYTWTSPPDPPERRTASGHVGKVAAQPRWFSGAG